MVMAMNSTSLKVATSALISFGITNGSISYYDTISSSDEQVCNFVSEIPEIYFTNKSRESTFSGVNAINFELVSSEILENSVEKFISSVRDSQNDIDHEVMSMINSNLWDLYG